MDFVKRSLVSGNGSFDPHTEPHSGATVGQVTFFLIWIGCFFLWLIRFLNNKQHGFSNHKKKTENGDDVPPLLENGGTANSGGGDANTTEDNEKSASETKVTVDVNPEKKGVGEVAKADTKVAKNFTAVKPPPTFDEFLRCVVIFGFVMMFFFLCDYVKVFPKQERVYSRDTFLFLVFLLFLIGCVFTIKPTDDKILNRDQTEEWKGWMQVMFVWYHVFAAKEWYNWIRVYIAAYVWMTGFGNFSFFWVRKDFSLWRFLKMQFRLNFLVTCLCVVTSNEYMLYYICAMHSYWFVTVYVFMRMLNSWNTDSKKMAVKFCAYIVVNAILFDIPVVRDNIFRPFKLLLQYNNPGFDPMHEWSFRAGLDHWACLVGMLCAYNYPHYESFMKQLEKSDNWLRKLTVKISMIFCSLVVLVFWYFSFMRKDKFSYNKIHPYTSFIPIICFIVIRNAFPFLRRHHVAMFAWLGKITLETYLSQLHIYLQSNAKHLIGYLVDYPLLNFALSTVIYLPISYLLFNLTTDFSAYLLPKDMKLVAKNTVIIAVCFGVPYTLLTLAQFI